MAYLDDILVFSETPERHLNHWRQVFRQLRRHGLKLLKCQFLKGFIISGEGTKPDLDKVEVIREMPEPKTVRHVWGFIGAIRYYRRFIPAFSEIVTPLKALTKNYIQFKWTKDCQRAFDTLTEQLTTVPLLTYPDLSKPMVLYKDASEKYVEAVLKAVSWEIWSSAWYDGGITDILPLA